MAELLLPSQPDSASDIGVSQGRFRRQIASAVAAIRGAMGGGDFDPESGMELAQRLLTSQFVIYVDPIIGRDTYRSGVANAATNPPLLNQQLECGYSPFAPFKSMARALLEVARISIFAGSDNDIYDRVVISVANGEHLIDNRASAGLTPVTTWVDGFEPTQDDLAAFNSANTPGLILPRGVSVLGMDLRKTVIRPVYVPPSGGSPSDDRGAIFRTTGGGFFFTFTFKDNLSERRSHHLLQCFDFCSTADLTEYYQKVVLAFGISGADVMPGETQIVAPYPSAPIPAVDSTVGSSCYVFSCSVRSDYGLCGIYLDGDNVTGFKSMVTAQFTQVSLQKDMNAWEVWNNGAWTVVPDYQAYINSDINNLRLRVGGNINVKTGCYDTDWRSFGFKCINNSIIQEVSCFVIGHSVHHWTASGGECTITNSNSNFGMTALLSSGFRGVGTESGAFSQDRNFNAVAIRRPLQVKQDGTNLRQIAIGTVKSYDAATGLLELNQQLPDGNAIEGRYSLRPGTYVWVDNRSRDTGPGAVPGDVQASVALPARARLSANPWDDATPDQIQVEAASSNINTIDPVELVGNRVYIRRLIDNRSPDQRELSLVVQTTAASRRPLGNYVLRLGGRNSVAAQLDPTNGAREVFIVTTSDVTTVPGSATSVASYKVIIRPGDSVEGFNASTYYQVGQPLFAENRVQRAKRRGTKPSFNNRVFEQSYSMLPDARGVEFGRAGIAETIVVDTDLSNDPASTTLGITLDTDPLVVAQQRATIDYIGLSDLMRVIGYGGADAEQILAPQPNEDARWWKPDGPNAPSPSGKLTAKGPWPLEFNRPSLIRAFGQAYEWAGQGNYTKAMPKFQNTVLSDQHKVDFFGVSHLGGRVYNTGFNEDGLLIQGSTIVDLASNRNLSTEVAGIGGLAGDETVLAAFPNEFEDLTVTRQFTVSGETDLNDLRLNGGVSGNPTWEEGVLPKATTTKDGIIRLATSDEARKFSADDAAITPATLIDALGDSIKGVANLRLSLRNDTEFPNEDAISSILYLYQFNGGEIALYSPRLKRWTIASFNNRTPFSLAPCTSANTNYDIYLYNAGTDLNPQIEVDFRAWGGSQTAPARTNFDGVECKFQDVSKRLVGVLRTESPGTAAVKLGGNIKVSDTSQRPRIGLANLYNPYAASLRYFFGTSWTDQTPNDGWAPPPRYSPAPSCDFVLARPALVTAFCDIYYNKITDDPNLIPIAYVAPGLDQNGPVDDAFYGEACLVGPDPVCATPSSQWARTLNPGFNQVYYLHRNFNGGALINDHAAHGLIVTVAL